MGNTTQMVTVGNTVIGGSQFAVIAGPCSFESPEQMTTTVKAVKSAGAHLLRGGIWKLRTNAKSFQGVGEEALGWVRQIAQDQNMHLVSEVTDTRQIEELHDVVSMFQVGSRNMHNYALLKELGKTRKPVLLKRGFSAFVTEWLQAAEYILQGGNDQVVLCERGIRTFENSTRNTLDLNSVAFVKARAPFPVIVDPSHGTGQSDLVSPLALAAAAVGADGLMIEVHPTPAEALSDGQQALTPAQFSHLMNQLKKILPIVGREL